MGGALAAAAAKTLPGYDILLADHDNARAEALAGELGACSGSNETAAAESHFLFLGVKPQMMEDLLTSIAPVLSARTDPFVLVTMAAGMTIARIQELAGGAYPTIRIMPNTPVSVGSGMILYTASANVTAEDKTAFLQNMAAAGRAGRTARRTDRRRLRHFRLRTRFCGSVSGGACRRRRGMWPSPG